jgi:pyridinium-3,5-biscarboxylic acid mononucleotide sulfurtransferase
MLASPASKEAQLISWLRDQGSVLVGYSGGVDSAYLACVAVDAVGADRMLAAIGRSASYPAEQWATARRVAAQFGVPVEEIDTDELRDPQYAANPANRCYFCKRELWGRLVPLARARGLRAIVDGTNADDLSDHRPGGLAGREHGVESPLAAVGLTKAEIRELSRARGLPTWDQPSAPCLSSRIPHGTPVTPARLRQVEAAEAALRAAGVVGDLRVRHHGELARVELAAEQLPAWLGADRRSIVAAAVLGAGYRRVAIDLAGFRSGSLNGQGGLTVVQGPEGWVENAELRARALDEGWAAGYRHVAAELAS